MSETEGRPSKIRKLVPAEATEAPEDPVEESPDLKFDEPKHSENPTTQETPENEENDISNIDVPEPMKDDPPLSKSQLKKRRRDEAWQAQKELRKEKRRDKRHEKQARKAATRAELQEKIAKGEIEAPAVSKEELAKKKQRPVLLPVTLIIDCDFDELMTEKELISLGAQLTRCYSDNRHSKYRAHMVMSSWEGALRMRFETVLTNHHKSWKGVRFVEKDFVGAADEIDWFMKSRNGGQLVGAFAPLEDIKVDVKEDGPQKENGLESQAVEELISKEIIMGESEELRLLEDGFQNHDQASEEPKDEPLAEQPSDATELMDPTTTSITTSSTYPSETATQRTKTKSPQITAATDPPSEPSIIYLTSDSPHTLDRLSPYTSYIIGGIVDKNRHKGLCYKRACERGIPTAKLPIGEFMTMQSRSVLAVNHVVEIMLKWLETGDWGEAFLSVIPKRKEAKLRDKDGGGRDDRGGREESEGEDDE